MELFAVVIWDKKEDKVAWSGFIEAETEIKAAIKGYITAYLQNIDNNGYNEGEFDMIFYDEYDILTSSMIELDEKIAKKA